MANDQIFKQIAQGYTQKYGTELLEQLALLEGDHVRYITPKLDRKIKKIGQINHTKRFMQGFSALAACLLLLLILPRMLNPAQSPMRTESAVQEQYALEAPVEEEAVEEDTELAEDAAPFAASSAVPELLPLAFALPEQFSVAEAKLDNGKSVYVLDDVMQDDVVLTMQLDVQQHNFEGLTQLSINEWPAYSYSGGDYKYLAFDKDGVYYELTCVYEMNTLVELASHIL